MEAVPVGSVFFDGTDILKKSPDGEWQICQDPDLAFVKSFFAPPGLELKVGSLVYDWTMVERFGVLQPRLLQEAGGATVHGVESRGDSGRDLRSDRHSESRETGLMAEVMSTFAEALRGRKRRRSTSSSSEEESEATLPEDLRDVALPRKVAKCIAARRFKEVELELLLDARDLAVRDRRGEIVTADRLQKAVLILVRHRSTYFPSETAQLLKFAFNVQDLCCSYEFSVVSRVVRKHIRAVAAGVAWGADISLGRMDQRDHLPLCIRCKTTHVTGACGAGGFLMTDRRTGTSGESGSRRPMTETVCFKCGLKGHFARFCPQLGKGVENRYRLPPKIGPQSKFGVQSDK